MGAGISNSGVRSNGGERADDFPAADRRRFIRTQLYLGCGLLTGASSLPAVQADKLPDSAKEAGHRLSKFFSVSQKLLHPLPVNTHIDRRVATRLLAALNSEYPSFAQQLDLLPEDPSSADRRSPVARLIVAAWYLGTVGKTLVTFERALIYRLTADALPVPSYCTGKPGDWSSAPNLKLGRV
ncbi:sugar dehydrogenase complex small subunit [Microbulbifer sp. HZ11]|uniref:sugar dehydrogenase complex small subunit n=1 Tax=unclassified Microbulbifer TaxID=2619833 RepID=UPI00069101C3|nr:sugar dehydrogenase complex small subunit [Microbulbifer sp. HZ11]